MLLAENVCLSLGGQEILHAVSVAIMPGQYNALIGPNGSGKTTLISVLSGYRKPNAGRACYEGDDVHRMRVHERALAFAVVQQHESVAMPFTAMEVVLMGLHPHRARLHALRPSDYAFVRVWMERTDTLQFADKPVQTLSGGEFERVVLARALVQRPRVLFLDEAMAEMDVRIRLDMQKLLRTEIAQTGMTVLAVHHDLSTAYLASDRIIALKGGFVCAQGATEAVLTRAFLAEVFGVQSEIHPGKGILIHDPIEMQKRGSRV
ncbi:MAG: ABC transporter ATP-binding protein [Clostridia bacterium]